MNKIEQLQQIIDTSNKIVFFTGAGVSCDSGIPDFRSQDGLYHMQYDYPPEMILSHTFFKNNPHEFFRFYRNKMIFPNAKPNFVHKFIASLEQQNKCLGVITQNIDGLHTKANSKNIIEFHGSIHRNYCEKCHKFYPLESIISTTDIPYCECGGIIKQDVVLYEEPLSDKVINDSIRLITNCDTLIILGTSLTVYPAASLVRYFKGQNLVVINKDTTAFDNNADLVINDLFANVLPKIKIAN